MSGRKLVVFGGTGFVGSQVVKHAVAAGWNVIVACRGGAPTNTSAIDPWMAKAHFVSIDALSRSQVSEFLSDHPDVYAMISCIGMLTTHHMDGRRYNGDPTINMAAMLHEKQRIRKLVFVSAARMRPLDKWPLKGYYQGKLAAERALLENLEKRSAVLRPGFIYGPREGPYGITLPLGLIGAPMRLVFAWLRKNVAAVSLLAPPISVDEVARCAVAACSDPGVTGVLEYERIVEVAAAQLQQSASSR